MTDGLFDAEPYQVAPGPKLGEDALRTQRAIASLAAGRHPVSRLVLHPDAPPVGDRKAPGPRCGTCAHLFRKVLGSGSTYLKCGENATGGPATDLRAWWPACAAYGPTEEAK